NLTTLIAALLLYAFGSGPVRGFAVTLSIGIITSMFTAIMLTRLMIVIWLRRTKPDVLPL
ncbi:MAG TPA: protein translocase subunit SecD, partial [Rhodospirillales bacterium]|nr:protein translocase subunit SecD [Rhodospirillales bacterium]